MIMGGDIETINPTIDVSGIPPHLVTQVEPYVMPLLENVLTRGPLEYLPRDILGYCKEGRMQLWVAADGADLRGCAVTELTRYPRRYVCTIILTAGTEFDKWKWGYKLIEQWARSHRVDEIRFYGRPGWKRKMQDEGFEHTYSVYSKELGPTDESLH